MICIIELFRQKNLDTLTSATKSDNPPLEKKPLAKVSNYLYYYFLLYVLLCMYVCMYVCMQCILNRLSLLNRNILLNNYIYTHL